MGVDQPGHQKPPSQVDHVMPVGDGDRGSRSDGGDPPAGIDHDDPVRNHRCAGLAGDDGCSPKDGRRADHVDPVPGVEPHGCDREQGRDQRTTRPAPPEDGPAPEPSPDPRHGE